MSKVTITWGVVDVQTLRPDWTEEMCEQFLVSDGKHLMDRSIEYGWQVLETLLGDWE